MRVYKFRSETRHDVALTVDISGRNLPRGHVWAWVGEVDVGASGLTLPVAELRRRLATEGLVVWP